MTPKAPAKEEATNVFPALLRYWRHARGMSQLDLAAAADVSTRHVSYLENGRSKPSREMILRLASTLAVPLREQNAILQTAGFAPQFDAPGFPALDHGPIADAIGRMMAQQEPFPLTVLDRHYNAIKRNAAATRMLSVLPLSDEDTSINMCEIVFDPNGIRPLIENWEEVARVLLSRLYRERLLRPNDEALAQLISRLMSYPDVPATFREQDFGAPSEAVVSIRLNLGGTKLGFFTTVTAFQAPQNVTLEEMLIESYFPLDDATDAFCRAQAEAAKG